MKNAKALLTAALLSLTPAFALAQAAPATPRPAVAAARLDLQQLRAAITAFYDAQDANNTAGMKTAAAQIHQLWTALPPAAQKRIENNHPGTAAHVEELHQFSISSTATYTKSGDTTTMDKTVTGPAGKTSDIDKTWTKDGNTTTMTGTDTHPDGKTSTQAATWVKNGDTTTGDKTITNANGKTETIDTTITKTGNTVTDDKTVTGFNGKTSDVDKTFAKDGNTVTMTGTDTGPNGKTATLNGTWTKDGNTTTGDKTITGPNGKTETVDSTRVKTGNTATNDRTFIGPKGNTQGTADTTTVRNGNTVDRTTTYADDTDLFGQRARRQAQSAGEGKTPQRELRAAESTPARPAARAAREK